MVRTEGVLRLEIFPTTRNDAEQIAAWLQGTRELPERLRRADFAGTPILLYADDDRDLESIVDRMKRELHVSARVEAPRVSYREVLRRSVEAQVTFTTRSVSANRRGHVRIRVSPGDPDAGCMLENAIAGSIPRACAAMINDTIRAALTRGVLAGYPLSDVRVEIREALGCDGEVSASDLKAATPTAFVEAARRAEPVLLEPVMHVRQPPVFLQEIGRSGVHKISNRFVS